ncbi:MAG: hypothetical protein E7331_06495 [Clostridiales bacterium]|nr:hypothetical protein [Clostridiales bacterium]
MNKEKASLRLCSASMLLYSFWLLLPAVQTLGGAICGAAAVALFVAGLLLDAEEWKAHWKLLIVQGACALAMPLVLYVFLQRGGASLPGFYAQNLMLWYPLIFASYALRKEDKTLWRYAKIVLIAMMLITTLTTIGWMCQGLTVKKLFHTYPRMLGSGATDPETARKLMLRNIGGYDFVYAAVMAIPLLCVGIHASKGWKRVGYLGFLALVLVMIVMSQYTYAMVYAAIVLVVELTALAVRKIFRIKLGTSLLIGLLSLVIIFLLREPIVSLGIWSADKLKMREMRNNLRRLLKMLQGTSIATGNRLDHYVLAWEGFKASPVIGTLFTAEKQLSQHSELLDLLSGMGVVGTALVGIMIGIMQQGLWKGAKKSTMFPHLVLMGAALLMLSTFGTSFYSRDVYLVYAMGLLLVGSEAVTPFPGPGEGSSDTLQTTGE